MAELPPNCTFALDAFEDDAFAELVTRYFTGPLHQDDLAELARRLEADPSARRLFMQFARLDGLLTERSLTGKAALPIAPNLMDLEAEEDASQLSMHDATVHSAIRMEDIAGSDASAEPVETFPIVSQSAPVPSAAGWRPTVIKISAAAAVLLVACLAMLAVLSSHHPQLARTEPNPIPASPAIQPSVTASAPPITAIQVPVVTEPEPAKLVAAVRAQWGGAGWPVLRVGDAVPDVPLVLKAGWIRVDFPSGVTAVVEAPAQFEVRSAMEVTLTSGRISAHVPPAGHGFAIQTPQCRAVDLGTEFGISVNALGQNLVQVFQGKVSLARGTPVATSQPVENAAGRAAGEIVVAGQGRRIESFDAPSVAVAADPSTFVLPAQFARWVKPHPTAVDQWRTFNEQLMRDPGLTLFYTLDDGDEHEIVNHAASTFGHYDLRNDDSHGPSWSDGRLAGISSLSFDSSKSQYLVLPKYPISQSGVLSGAVWVNARSYVPFGSILKSWGDTKCGSFHLGFGGATHQMEIELDGTRPGGPVLADPEDFPLNRWVHLAFVSDAKTVRLYRDGKEVASCPSRLIPNNPVITSMAIGCKTGDDGINPATNIAAGFWDGEIGEIALFQRVLAPEEILRMSQQSRP